MVVVRVPDARTLEISGHADAGEKGGDIVCAGVSAVAMSVAGAIEDRRLDAHIRIDEGYLLIRAEETAACFVIATAVSGLRRIAAQYPDYVRIEEEKI